MMLKKISVVLAFLAFASPSFAQVAMSRNGGGSGSSGSSTITNGVTATSGCVAGGVLRSISNLVECGAGITWSGGTFTLNNGAAAVSPLVVQDNGINIVSFVDGGNMTISPNAAWTLSSSGGTSSTINVSARGSLNLIAGNSNNGEAAADASLVTNTDSGSGTFGLVMSGGSGDVNLKGFESKLGVLLDYSESSTSAINSGFNITANPGATSTGFGNGLRFAGQSSTTASQDMIRIAGVWTDATHASRSAAVVFEVVNGAAALAEAGRFNAVGGLKIATGTKPTCDSTYRGTLYYVAGGAGVADTYEVCRKDAGDAYAWTAIY